MTTQEIIAKWQQERLHPVLAEPPVDQGDKTIPGNEYADFIAFLNEASRIVATWPKWKQEILGGRFGRPIREVRKEGEKQ